MTKAIPRNATELRQHLNQICIIAENKSILTEHEIFLYFFIFQCSLLQMFFLLLRLSFFSRELLWFELMLVGHCLIWIQNICFFSQWTPNNFKIASGKYPVTLETLTQQFSKEASMFQTRIGYSHNGWLFNVLMKWFPFQLLGSMNFFLAWNYFCSKHFYRAFFNNLVSDSPTTKMKLVSIKVHSIYKV